MELTITLPDELVSELRREAERRGIAPTQFASQIIQQHLPAARPNSLKSLFEQWEREDATTDPEELVRRRQEWEELRQALNANRGSGRKLFPE